MLADPDLWRTATGGRGKTSTTIAAGFAIVRGSGVGPGQTTGGTDSRADLSGDAHSFSELVIHEVRDIPSSVPHESRFPIVVDRKERLLPDGHEKMALSAAVTHEAVSFTGYRDDVIG